MTDYGKNNDADREILRDLRGDRAAKERAIERTDRLYGLRVCNVIRPSFPSLSDHDVLEAWNDTLLDLLDRARSGRLREDRPLSGLLYTICWRRAVDILRRYKNRRDLEQLAEAALDSLATAMQTDPAAFQELLSQVEEAVRHLSPKQRLVWEVYADLDRDASLKELTAAVNRRLGTPVSETTVRKRLEAGRNALRARLRWVFREWFGPWFDRWFPKLFNDWLDENFDPRTPNGLDDDEGRVDGETET